jgi:hypothetical protein
MLKTLAVTSTGATGKYRFIRDPSCHTKAQRVHFGEVLQSSDPAPYTQLNRLVIVIDDLGRAWEGS